MQSTQGEYFVGLDHVRALAAFTVFTWHFNQINGGHLSGPETYPLSFFAEGHLGVAMFMALSGYLFAKLLDGQSMRYFPFLWNRAIRLFPLLLLTFVLHGFLDYDWDRLSEYLSRLVKGFVTTGWPGGGWSIAVEIHFYIILPLLLALSSRRASLILLAIVASLALRTFLWVQDGSIQHYAFWTIVGGIDQFVFGIFAFKARHWVAHRHLVAALMVVVLTLYVTYFDASGGYFRNPSYPSPSPVWITHPTILGAAFGFLIAWYDTSFSMSKKGLSGAVAAIGACSYSIYLLHFFVVFNFARWINANVVELTAFPVVLIASLVSFLCFVPVAYASYRYIELPPMRYRVRYKVDAG